MKTTTTTASTVTTGKRARRFRKFKRADDDKREIRNRCHEYGIPTPEDNQPLMKELEPMIKREMFITPKFTVVNPVLSKPDDNGKYSIGMVFEPGTDISTIRESTVLIDGGELDKRYTGLPAAIAYTSYPPATVDRKKRDISSAAIIPGTKARAVVTAFPYFKNGETKLSLGFGVVQLQD